MHGVRYLRKCLSFRGNTPGGIIFITVNSGRGQFYAVRALFVCLPFYVQKLDSEYECGVGRNDISRAALTVTKRIGYIECEFRTDGH